MDEKTVPEVAALAEIISLHDDVRYANDGTCYCLCGATFPSTSPGGIWTEERNTHTAEQILAWLRREADAGGEVEARLQIAWMLWCINEGYLLSEDREILTNWMGDDGATLHPDDVETRRGLLSIADDILASDWLAAHDASVVAAARADADATLGDAAKIWGDGWNARARGEFWETNPYRNLLDAAAARREGL